MTEWMKFVEDKMEIVDESTKKWLQGAIKHPGRCADMGSTECPKGSPQYNLAKTLKKKHGFHHKKKKTK